MRKKNQILSVFVVAALGITPAFAKGTTEIKMETPAPAEGTYTPEQFKALVKKMENLSQRKFASVETLEETEIFSKDYLYIRDKVIGAEDREIEVTDPNGSKRKVMEKFPGAKTAAQISALLNKLDADFKAGKYNDPDARLLAAQLLMLKPFEGFIHRARGIFEKPTNNLVDKVTGKNKARMAHAMAVTGLRAMAAGIDTYLPTEQWKAGFDYAILPTYGAGKEDKTCGSHSDWSDRCELSTDARIQAWLYKEVHPRLVALHQVLYSSDYSNKPVYWDNKLLYASAPFVSQKDRFIRLGEAERLLMLSGTQAALSTIFGVQAFHFDGLFESIDKVAKIYGFQNAFDPGHATAKDRFDAIRSFPRLFALKNRTLAIGYLNSSYFYLKNSLQNSYAAWKYLDAHENDTAAQDNLIDPRLVAPFQRILNGTTGVNGAFQNAFAIAGISPVGKGFAEVAEGDVMSALFQGEKVTVRLKKFFMDPPDSLQEFMPGPTQFEGGEEWLTHKVDGQNVQYRNYRRGNPTGWNVSAYQKYFPGVNSPEEVRRTARILSQSWGGFFLGLPISMVIM